MEMTEEQRARRMKALEEIWAIEAELDAEEAAQEVDKPRLRKLMSDPTTVFTEEEK